MGARRGRVWLGAAGTFLANRTVLPTCLATLPGSWEGGWALLSPPAWGPRRLALPSHSRAPGVHRPGTPGPRAVSGSAPPGLPTSWEHRQQESWFLQTWGLPCVSSPPTLSRNNQASKPSPLTLHPCPCRCRAWGGRGGSPPVISEMPPTRHRFQSPAPSYPTGSEEGHGSKWVSRPRGLCLPGPALSPHPYPGVPTRSQTDERSEAGSEAEARPGETHPEEGTLRQPYTGPRAQEIGPCLLPSARRCRLEILTMLEQEAAWFPHGPRQLRSWSWAGSCWVRPPRNGGGAAQGTLTGLTPPLTPARSPASMTSQGHFQVSRAAHVAGRAPLVAADGTGWPES